MEAYSSVSDSIPGASNIYLSMITANDPKHEVQLPRTRITTALSINPLNYTANPWTVKLDIKGTTIHFKTDTRAEIDELPKTIHRKLQERPKLFRTSMTLSINNGTSISALSNALPPTTTRTQSRKSFSSQSTSTLNLF